VIWSTIIAGIVQIVRIATACIRSQVFSRFGDDAASSPRILCVLAGGHEAQMNEADLDLRDPANWSYWNAAVHAATMCTLALERLARGNPRLSVVHWDPGPVATPGLAKWDKYGLTPPNQRSQDEAGKRGVFLATSDRYAVQGHSGLVPVPEGLGGVNKSGGGSFWLMQTERMLITRVCWLDLGNGAWMR